MKRNKLQAYGRSKQMEGYVDVAFGAASTALGGLMTVTGPVGAVAGGVMALAGAGGTMLGLSKARRGSRISKTWDGVDFSKPTGQTMRKKVNKTSAAAKKRKAASKKSAPFGSTKNAKPKRSVTGTVKTHARRTKSGKTATVKQHSRTPTRNPKR